MIPVPYKVRGDHQIIHVGGHTYMWGTIGYLFHIRYGGAIRVILDMKILHM